MLVCILTTFTMTILNLPTWLTLSRIAATPIIVLLLYFPHRVTCLLACLLYMAASASDFFDGRLARKSGQVTSFGKFLDPLADKVLNCSILIMLSFLRDEGAGDAWVPAWVTIIIICRELMVTGLRAIAADEGHVMAADRFGKLKTVLQGLALVPLTLHYPWFGVDVNPAGKVLLYIALCLTVFSGANYMFNFYRYWRGTVKATAPHGAEAVDGERGGPVEPGSGTA